MTFWDQKKGLEAHRRLAELPVTRIDTSGERRWVIRPKTAMKETGEKPHLCRFCGETEKAKFYARRKATCITCILKHLRERNANR